MAFPRLSTRETWLVIVAAAFVATFAIADDLIEADLGDSRLQLVVRLVLVTLMMFGNKIVVMRTYRDIIRRQAIMVPAFRLLTTREREILGLVARGLSAHDIAVLLFVSEDNVQQHLDHIEQKLGVASASQLISWGTELAKWMH